jgi:hypothetical protein
MAARIINIENTPNGVHKRERVSLTYITKSLENMQG